MPTYTLPQNLGDILGAHHDGNFQTQVSEIKAGIGTLLRGTVLASGTAGDIGKLVKLTAGTEASAYGILLDPAIDTAVAFGDREAMAIAERRGELIEKSFVSRQAQYIFITLRQAILNFPTRYARHVVGVDDEHQAKAVLKRAAHEFLTELASFPEKAIDSNWLQSLEADGEGEGGKPPRPSSGHEIRTEQKKAKIRRKKKTETMRRLRAKG